LETDPQFEAKGGRLIEVISLEGAVLQEYDPEHESNAFQISTANRVIVLK
jgi:hypothetical protein